MRPPKKAACAGQRPLPRFDHLERDINRMVPSRFLVRSAPTRVRTVPLNGRTAMKWSSILVMLVFGVAFGSRAIPDDIGGGGAVTEAPSRSVKDLPPIDIQNIAEHRQYVERPAPKRRRLRKRKKKPPPTVTTEEPEEIATLPLQPDDEQSNYDLKSILKRNGGLSLSEILQKKNLTLVELLRGNKKAISALTAPIDRNYDSSEQTTSSPELATERRIFVPYHPIYYTSVDVKLPPFEVSSTTTSTAKPQPRRKTKPPKIDAAGDIYRYNGANDTDHGPLKLSIGFEEVRTQPTTTATKENEKIKPLTARDEIMSIMERPDERDRILRVLQLRNMTVEELIEQRERGSSQIHLADIFHNDDKEPEPDVVHVVSETGVDFETMMAEETGDLPALNRRQKIPQSVTIVTTTSFPSVKIETVKGTAEIYADTFRYGDDAEMVILESNLLEADRNLDNTEAKLYLTSEQLQLDDETYVYLPSGVKSAVLASMAIAGLSVLVFLAVMFGFRWAGVKTVNYRWGDKTGATPFFETQRRNIKHFVVGTLGKSYCKSPAHRPNAWQSKAQQPF
ncbi:uncharacterized protein LOC132704678 [Cylas formicarius]|uniref:uncharacterized protein LOC132704678 n=1 Tax=Cylas formicarius TaxID=197179 RepID=UPI0029584453|nr:uncharacterized protein LOC132704678 [Cylas formicarius]